MSIDTMTDELQPAIQFCKKNEFVYKKDLYIHKTSGFSNL